MTTATDALRVGVDDRHKTFRRAMAPWFAAEFFASYAATLLTIGCYDYATSDYVRASPSARLWMSAAWGFAYIFISLAAGRISERFGPKRAIIFMLAGSAIAALIGLWAIHVPTIWVLVIIMFGFNITSSMVWPAMESAITRSPGSMRLNSRMAGYNLSWGLANFAAFFTRGPLEHFSWSTIFWVPALSGAIACGVVALWAVPSRLIGAHQAKDTPQDEHELDSPAMRAKADLMLKLAWIGNALSYVAINVLFAVLSKLAFEAGYATLSTAGMITAIWGFTRFVGFFLNSRWRGWHYRIGWLLGAQAVLTVSFCFMLTIHTPVMLISSQIIFGFATALIYSSSLYYAMHVSSGHGGHAGIHEALIGLGFFLGPTVGAIAGMGQIGRPALLRIGFGVTGILVLGILLMAFVAYHGLKRARLAAPSPSEEPT